MRITGKSVIRNLLLLLFCLGLMGAAAACGSDEDPQEPQNEYTQEVKLYYANMAYVESGDESLGHLVGPYDYKLQTDREEAALYRLVIDSSLRLEADPSWPDAENAITMITDDIQFHNIHEENGTIIVDVQSENADGEPLSGGSYEERLLIEQITFTLLDSFPDAQQVLFWVDGEEADTLMGHMDIQKAFDRNSFGTASQRE